VIRDPQSLTSIEYSASEICFAAQRSRSFCVIALGVFVITLLGKIGYRVYYVLTARGRPNPDDGNPHQ
jgi:hypothetical protein